MTSERSRLLTVPQLIAAAAALLVTVAAAVVVAIALPPVLRAASPDVPVTAYLGALSRGDVPAALKLGQITPAGTSLLTADAYAKASARITSFRVTATEAHGGTATVTARITQGKRSYSARFTAVRGAGVPGLAPWKLAPQQLPKVSIAVVGPALRVTVAGVPVADTMSVTVLPGTYTVAAASSPDYSAAPRAVTAVLGETTAPARLNVGLTAAGKAAVQASADAWLGTCAASHDLAPAGCPFRALPTPGIDYSNGHWAIAAQPTLVVGAWSAAAGGWQVATAIPGSVSFTAQATQGNQYGTASTGPHEFVIAGTAVPSGAGIAFVPSPSYAGAAVGAA